MICTKCNNEIPDGAKFCPSCGASALAAPVAAAAPETEKKIYCEKCGLELMNGAKFCSVCGGSGVARDAVPTTAGDDMGMAAVDLNKPSQSDSLVSAMNGVSAAATGAPIPGIPMPSNDVPTPSNGSTSSTTASGYAPSNAMPVIPPYVASVSADAQQAPVMPMPTPSGAAAVSAKKSNGGKIALFSVLGVLLIAIAAVAVMFFTNRAALLSAFMGKAKYATMIEGTSIKDATEKLDIPAIANGIKSASGTYQAMASTMGDNANPFMSYSGASSKTAPMSMNFDTLPIDPEFNAGFNVSELSKELAEMMQTYYGANTIGETLTMNVQLSDSVRAMLGAGSIDVDSYLDLINGTTVNYTLSANDDKTAIAVGTNGQITVNAKILLDGQDVYVALPFASEKAILISVPGSSESIKSQMKPLELDEKELERLITECVEIYLDHYKSASIEMESGEISAAGVTVNGKLITAEFKGEQLSKLITDITKHIVTDDYLMTQLADYANSCGADTTKQELIDEALEEIEYLSDVDDSDRLVIETVIDRNGNVLGKTIKAISEWDYGDIVGEFSYAETKDRAGVVISYVDPGYEEFTVNASIDKIDEKSGTCNIDIKVEEDEMSFTLNYSDVKKAEFCGKEIYTGNFSLAMNLPESFSDQLGKDAWAAVNGAKLNFGLAADSKNSIEYSISVEVPSYGSVSLKDIFTVSNDDSAFTKPANVLDITDAMLNGMPDQATMAELEKFGEDVMNALKSAVPEFVSSALENLPGSMIGGIDGPTVYPGKTSSLEDNIADLLDDIKGDMEDIQKALNGELTYSSYYTSSELETMLSEYSKLYLEILVKGNDMTAEEYYAFDDRYWDLLYDLPYFDDPNQMSGYGYNDPRLNKISEDLTNCYVAASNIGDYYEEKLSGIPEAKKLYDELEKAYSNLEDYLENTNAYDFDELTDAQLTEVERLLDIVEDKIDAFMAKYNFR